MFTKRIIPCLDVHNGRVVKGVNFVNLRDAGDPVEIAAAYDKAGADELVFLDITASSDARTTVVDMVRKVAECVFIPFTVGGGINHVADVETLLGAGADKISINSAALRNPDLIDDIASRFGRQVCVTAIDARFDNGEWICYLNGGRVPTSHRLLEWAHEAQERGAGEILFTSMNHDGVKTGFACEVLAELADNLEIPIIASGGAGNCEHFRDVFTIGKADAALAASIFHFNEVPIAQLKTYLKENNIIIRQ